MNTVKVIKTGTPKKIIAIVQKLEQLALLCSNVLKGSAGVANNDQYLLLIRGLLSKSSR